MAPTLGFDVWRRHLALMLGAMPARPSPHSTKNECANHFKKTLDALPPKSERL